MGCFSLIFLYFVKQRYVTNMRTWQSHVCPHLTVFSHELFPYVLCCEGVAATLSRDQHNAQCSFSLWRTLRIGWMDLHIPDNSFLSHSTCFIKYWCSYVFKKCRKSMYACFLCSVVGLLEYSLKIKIQATKLDNFRACASLLVCVCLTSYMLGACPAPPSLSPGFDTQTYD